MFNIHDVCLLLILIALPSVIIGHLWGRYSSDRASRLGSHHIVCTECGLSSRSAKHETCIGYVDMGRPESLVESIHRFNKRVDRTMQELKELDEKIIELMKSKDED